MSEYLRNMIESNGPASSGHLITVELSPTNQVLLKLGVDPSMSYILSHPFYFLTTILESVIWSSMFLLIFVVLIRYLLKTLNIYEFKSISFKLGIFYFAIFNIINAAIYIYFLPLDKKGFRLLIGNQLTNSDSFLFFLIFSVFILGIAALIIKFLNKVISRKKNKL